MIVLLTLLRAKLLQTPEFNTKRPQNHTQTPKKRHFLNLFCHYLMTSWQYKALIFSRGGADFSVGEGQIRQFSKPGFLTIYTHTFRFQIQFYNLKVILGGNSCIVSLPIVNLNIYFGIRYANCDMSNSISYKIPKVKDLFDISKKFMEI